MKYSGDKEDTFTDDDEKEDTESCSTGEFTSSHQTPL